MCPRCGSKIVTKDTLCQRCRQKVDDARYSRYVALINELSYERGECEDHTKNFGERMLYSEDIKAAFQWDHRYGEKKYKIADMRHRHEIVRAEVAKCALVCANCHALETQRNWHRQRPGVRVNHERGPSAQ